MAIPSFDSYVTPGVYVGEDVQPVVSDMSTAQTVVALIGEAVGYQIITEEMQLTSAQWASGSTSGASVTGMSVISVTSGTAISSGSSTSGYVAQVTNGYINVKPAVDGFLEGERIWVTYRYVSSGYYQVQSFTDYDDIRTMYGEPWTSGGINSNVSLAAWLAMTNGAKEIMICAVQTSAVADYEAALNLLTNEEANVVIPVTGNSSVHSSVQNHVDGQSLLNHERIAIVGRDSSSTAITTKTLQQAAASFNDSRVILVSPASINIFNRESNAVLEVGSQYVAAALSGMLAARAVQIPLTRKRIYGFDSMAEKRTETDKVNEGRSGVLCYEDYKGIIRIRHSVTTKQNANDNTREVNVIRAKDWMMTSLRENVDVMIGEIITDDTIQNLKTLVAGTLERLKANSAINAYANLKARQPSDRPTVIEVKFEVKPTYGLNYILIGFSINTQTGSITQTYVGSQF